MRKYGCIKDTPDGRDRSYKFQGSYIADHVDLRMFASPVEEQGQTSSCTGNAVVGALELDMKRNRLPFYDLSRLFPYYNARVIEGDAELDNGAMIRDVIKCLANKGICSEKTWGFDPARVTEKPSEEAYKEAEGFKIIGYRRLRGIQQALESLTEGVPVVFGVDVYESFESDETAHTGVIKMPLNREHLMGGHAICMVGYDKPSQYATIRNSWGIGWGQRGYCQMPFEYIENHGRDFWKLDI